MEGTLYASVDGGKLTPLAYIDEGELSVESEVKDGTLKRYLLSKELTIDCQLSEESVNNIEKYIVCGGDRGKYNGYRLKKDGYLSPENAWLEKNYEHILHEKSKSE